MTRSVRTIAPFLAGMTFLALTFAARPAAPEARTFFVAPAGDDRNPGTENRPFATVEKARDAVRALRRKQGGKLKQPVTVLLRGGTYSLKAPLVLTPEDSGTEECPVTYQAFPGEKPVLSGGRRVTGWKETTVRGKRLWAAHLPEVKTGRWYFHQLWVDGKRRYRARHPNAGFLKIAGLPDVRKDTPWNRGQKRFRFAAGDVRRWDNLADVDVVVLHLWVGVRLAVESVDEKERVVTFLRPSARRLTDGDAPARYYLENALEFLDAPGEWYLDRKGGTLYYLPARGEKFPGAGVVAPALTHLMRLEGKPEAKQYVEYARLRGLTFAHSEWWPARTDPLDTQAAITVPGCLQGDGVRHCAVEKCMVAHVSNYGVHLGRGCRHNTVSGCELFDLGAGGVKVGETVVRDDPGQQTHDNEVSDNHVHDAGRTFPQAVGLWVGQSYRNRVVHNHVHDLDYTGISCGWTWGYGKALARDNEIAFNHVHDLGKGVLSDMGGIYTLGKQPGTVIRANVFHDVSAHRYGGWGIYLDEGTSEVVAEGNLVYRTTHGGFHQHYGRDNVVRNNVFALGRDAQVRRTRVEPHRSFTFERNVVYWKTGKLLDGDWSKLNVVFDRNVYGKAGGGEVRFGKWTWKEWRGKGMDRGSLLADPLFADPGKGDFRLKAGSPARKVGFVPPEVSKAGPRK